MTDPDTDKWDTATNGMIFEFKKLEQAKAFAEAVKSRFKLDGRVFDNAEAAERAHMFPWAQNPPVVHIDRPWWFIPDGLPEEVRKEEWDKAFKLETKIEKLAVKFGGEFVGT
jgi:hypothetical protein